MPPGDLLGQSSEQCLPIERPVVLAEGVEHEIRIVRDAGELAIAVWDLQRIEMLLEVAIEAERLIEVADDLTDEQAGAEL